MCKRGTFLSLWLLAANVVTALEISYEDNPLDFIEYHLSRVIPDFSSCTVLSISEKVYSRSKTNKTNYFIPGLLLHNKYITKSFIFIIPFHWQIVFLRAIIFLALECPEFG